MKTTANTLCTRCGNNGMAHYGHKAGGVCFACGRHPEADDAPAIVGREVSPATLREETIHALYARILRAEEEAKRGTVAAWWPGVVADVRYNVERAPADVAARARRALAKLGCTV